MTTRTALSTILFIGLAAIAGCAAEVPEGGDGGGGGSGDGGGGGGGSGGGGGGDGGDDGDDGGGGGVTPTQVIEKISTAECDQAHACKATFPTDAGVTFDEIFGATAAACYPLNADYWDAPAVEAGVTAGTIMFDQTAASACMSGATTAPACTAFWMEGPGLPDACWDTFTGTIAAGGQCTTDFACSGELYCGETGTCVADTAARPIPSDGLAAHPKLLMMRGLLP
jgi:hypothetical protein